MVVLRRKGVLAMPRVGSVRLLPEPSIERNSSGKMAGAFCIGTMTLGCRGAGEAIMVWNASKICSVVAFGPMKDSSRIGGWEELSAAKLTDAQRQDSKQRRWGVFIRINFLWIEN